MLSAIARLRDRFEFVAFAPPDGRLASLLRKFQIDHVPIELRDDQGARIERSQVLEHLRQRVESTHVDVLHSNSLSMGRLTGVLNRSIRPACVSHLRDIMKVSKATINDLNGNDLLLAVSAATKSFHLAQGLDPDRTEVLYNGVDCERFQNRARKGFLRRELGLPDDAFLAATIGQIGLRKGQDVLARAVPNITEHADNIHFLLVGERNSSKQESREFESAIQQEFHSHGLQDKLHQLGYREEMEHLMNEFDLLIHPAHQEPLGRVLLESAACELPIVATSVGGTSEILTDGESASLVPAGDPQQLAAAVVALYSDQAKRQRFGTAAREVVRTRFNIERTSANLAGIWDSIERVGGAR